MAEYGSFDSYPLTPLDHTIPAFYVFFFLSFRLERPPDVIPVLQTGIARLVAGLPFLNGVVTKSSKIPEHQNVLEVQPGSTMLEISPMLKIQYHRDCTLSNTDLTSLGESFYPLARLPTPCQQKCIVRFQANILEDAIILNMAFNHSVFDGTGAGTILELLAECCQKLPIDTATLSTDMQQQAQARKIAFETYVPESQRKDHVGSFSEDPALPESLSEEELKILAEHASLLVTKEFFVSTDKIECIKEAFEALKEMLPEDGGEEVSKIMQYRLSSNDIVTALIGVCLNRCGTKEENEFWSTSSARKIQMAANLRKRLQPPLQEGYLGNMATTTLHHLNAKPLHPHIRQLRPNQCPDGIDNEDLLPILNLALHIRENLTLLEDGYIRSLISHVKDQSDWKKVNVRFGDINVSSWRHLKIYRLDFGAILGRVERLDMQSGLIDFCGVIMPERHERSDPIGNPPWDLRITLNPISMELLLNDKLFSWFLLKESCV